jgi:hypothetical protein
MEGSNRGELRPETVRYVLERVARRWVEVQQTYFASEQDIGAGEERWPWGVWICQYGVVPESYYLPESYDFSDPEFPKLPRPLGVGPPSLHAVWFVDARGITPRNPWEFVRFHLVQFERPWMPFWEENPLFSRHRRPIATAAFAPYEDGNHVYYEEIWGDLWGLGYRLTIDEDGAITGEQDLWIS